MFVGDAYPAGILSNGPSHTHTHTNARTHTHTDTSRDVVVTGPGHTVLSNTGSCCGSDGKLNDLGNRAIQSGVSCEDVKDEATGSPGVVCL